MTLPPVATPPSPTLDPALPGADGGAEIRCGRFRAYSELGKFRLNGLVLVTTAVGFVLASSPGINWLRLLLTLVGTGLAAVGAAAINQVIETPRDARMLRTCHRPLPSGQITKLHGLFVGLFAAAAGVEILSWLVSPLVAGLALANLLIYLLAYTPLKTRTSLNTLVGAICGALPPMMGWAAAAGTLSLGAYLLGAILFIWQIPHFLALAWMYRGDYARGGFRMLPVVDPSGRLTCLLIVLYSLALLPLGLAVSLAGIAGWYAAIGSVTLGFGLFLLALNLMRRKTEAEARRVFLASVTYLPLLLILMVADAARGPLPTGAISSPPAAAAAWAP